MKHVIKKTALLFFAFGILLCSNLTLYAKSENSKFKKINKEISKESKKAKKNSKQTQAPNWKKWKNSNSQKYFH